MDKAYVLQENKDKFPLITDITIDRLFLRLIIFDPGDHYIYMSKGKEEKILLSKEQIEKDTYRISLELFCIDNKGFLENGLYSFGFYDTELAGLLKKGGIPFFSCAVHEDIARMIPSLSRVYKYGSNNYAYNISFNVFSSDDVIIHIKMASFFVRIDKGWHKRTRESVRDFHTFKKKSKSLLKSTQHVFLRLLYRIFVSLCQQKSVMIIYKFTGSLAGNLAAIYKRMQEQGIDRNRSIVLQSSDGGRKNVNTIEYMKIIRKLAQAEYIFVDGPVPILKYIKLSDKTKLVQLWHAGAGFKGAGFARFGIGESIFPNNLSHRQVSHALAASPPLIDVFNEVIGIPKDRFFIANMPRLDNWLNAKNIEQVKEKFFSDFPEFSSKKIILFAPTYRGKVSKGYYPYHMMDFKRVYDLLGEDSVMIVKMHPNIIESPVLDDFSKRIIDLSGRIEINDILLVTDVLITDYSSTYYDFALLKRPMIFFCFDKYIYENTRGVYQTVDDAAPGKVVNTFDELLTALQNDDYDFDKTLKFYDDFFSDYNSQQSASDYIIDNFLLKRD